MEFVSHRPKSAMVRLWRILNGPSSVFVLEVTVCFGPRSADGHPRLTMSDMAGHDLTYSDAMLISGASKQISLAIFLKKF